MVNQILIVMAFISIIVGTTYYVTYRFTESKHMVERTKQNSKINTLSKERDDLNITIVESEAKRDFESIEEAIEYESTLEKDYTKRMIEDESITTFNDNF